MFLLLFEIGAWGRLNNFSNYKENVFPAVSNLAEDPVLQGPDLLCNTFGSVLADYYGGGNPATDVYSWEILDPSGTIVFDFSGGALFQTISFTFSEIGNYEIRLVVKRGVDEIFNEKKSVKVMSGPQITLTPNYSLCENQSISLEAISPSSPNYSDYNFEWYTTDKQLIGSNNSLEISVPGTYEVTFYLLDGEGEKVCSTTLSTEVTLQSDYQINASETTVCPDLPTVFTTSPLINGEWRYQKEGTSTSTLIGFGNTLNLLPNQSLPEVGIYKIIFVPDVSNGTCLVEKSVDLVYNPQPEFIILGASGASDCDTKDGTLTIQAVTPLDFVYLEGLGINTPPLAANQTFTITNLKSGTYSLVGILGTCSNSYGTAVPLINPPSQLQFEIANIVGEKCTSTGKLEGSFLIRFINPPSSGSYRIINQKGTMVQEGDFNLATQIPITIPGGVYFVEVFSNLDCNLPEANEVLVPSLDQTQFSIPDELFICQEFSLTPETSQNLEFTLVDPDGVISSEPSGDSFSITKAGEYRLIGSIPGSSTVCPTEKKFTVSLVDPVDSEPVLIQQDCFGNQTFQAVLKNKNPDEVNFAWYNEKDELIGTGEFLFPISYGTFKLDVQPANSEACPISPKEFEINAPILSVEVSLTATKLCEFGPRAIVTLTSTFPDEITNVEWRRYDASGITEIPEYSGKYEITVDIPGTYEASVYSIIPSIGKNCELGRSNLQLDLIPDKVEFDVPSSLSICETYQLIPQSAEYLEFSLTFPDGKTEVKTWKEPFTLDQEGTYTILGYDPDITGPKCPEQKTIEVIINSPVQFEPILMNISCAGTYEYLAVVGNYAPDLVDYFWRDTFGNLVSTEKNLITATYGTFSLEVQPKGSIPCQIQPTSFEIPVPVLSVATKIIAEPLCPDQPDAVLKLESKPAEVATIEWWYTDINNNRSQFISGTNKVEILAANEGTYEVILKNQFGCFLGGDEVLVLRSSDQVRPIVEEIYQVCPKYEIGPVLNPGSFASYEWYFGEDLVSTSSSFKPLQVGSYRLVVFSSEGCAYETSFVTEEECELRVIFPNAIQPGNPDRPFLIYTNYLIDELEIWIFSKWGEVIFHCENTQLLTEESTCLWDGYFNGQKVPPGSYAYRVNFRNLEKNISKEQLGSILIID